MPSISVYHAAEPRHTLSHLSSEAPQLFLGYGAGGAATVAYCSLDKGVAITGGGLLRNTVPEHSCVMVR